MRIVRFSPLNSKELGNDPLYGQLDGEIITVIKGDPIYSGIQPTSVKVKLADVRLLAPVIPRSKVVCVGKNYSDHAKEMGMDVPEEPIIFLKPNTSVIGPNDLIQWPRMSERVDFEGELAIVISRICKDVPKEKFSDVIFGYTIANDVTARDLQKKDGQWNRGKGFDTFCPLGPWIETEFVPEGQVLETRVEGEIRQRSSNSNMIFDIPRIIQHVTEAMTLLPGDVIFTGAPAGVGPVKPGDLMIGECDVLGPLEVKCYAYKNPRHA